MRFRSLPRTPVRSTPLAVEALEHRTPLSADGLTTGGQHTTEQDNSPIAIETAQDSPAVLTGDANADGIFNQLDVVQVLLANKYLTAEPANWSEGDWNGDSVFDQRDIVAALQTGHYFSQSATALAQGATQISGIGFFDDLDVCGSGNVGADFALILSGELEGCLYTFVATSESSPSGTYRESGTEIFVDSQGAGTFSTTYRFEAKYEDVDNLSGEIFGRCQHVVVEGSGTGIYDGVTGRVDFKDDVDAGNFPYRGHLRW